jgi:3-oxocholest-4-en-26-oyl-CoA dehydrogenase alpha subunit
MDFVFSEEQRKLMDEVRQFCINELPEDYDSDYVGGPADSETYEFWKQFRQKAAKRGWPAAGLPKKYGGMGLPVMEEAAINSEIAYWGANWESDPAVGLITSAVLTAGTEEQKQKWIPPIVRGEITAFQAFTEPEAGSDVASVQLRAITEGDHFILNGQKVFISGDIKPDWLYTIVKTAEVQNKHQGLSILMVPGDAPGVTFRPLINMGGFSQNEIFFDNVKVPKSNLLGDLNRGFYLAMATFEFERAHGGGLGTKRNMEKIIQFCRKENQNKLPLVKDPKVREIIARMAIASHLAFLFGWHVTWVRARNEKLEPQTRDVSTLFTKWWNIDDGQAMMRICGLFGQLRPGSKYAKYRGKVSFAWELTHITSGGGTPEIRKNIIANRGLGLPKVPRKFNAMIKDSLERG